MNDFKKLSIYPEHTEVVTSATADMIQTVLNEAITTFTKKTDDFILDLLRKQKGFVSLEKSKDLIRVEKLDKNQVLQETRYYFNDKLFLITYPSECREENGRYVMSFNYRSINQP